MSFVAHPEGVRASSAVLPSSPPPSPNTQHNRPPQPKRLRRSRHEPIEPIPEYHAPTDIESDLPEDSIPEIPSASSDSPTMDEYCARNRLDGKKRKGYLEIKGAMSRSRVSLIHFLSMWIHDDSNAGGKGSSYSSQQSRVKQVTDFFDDKETQTVLRRIRIPEETAKTDALQQTQSALKEELDGLVGRPPFVKWSADNSPVLCVPASAHMIKSCAGRLYKLLAYLLTNPRQSKEENTEVEEGSEAASEKKRGYAIFFITLILMYARAPRMSDQAATIVGLYFHATGASKRTMDVVGKIGVAPSYTTLRDRIRLVAERGDRDLKINGQRSQVCIAVDNVDIRDNVRDQRTGDTLTTHHLTSGLIFINKEAPPRRHQQHEFHRSERLREGPFTKTLTTTWHCIGSGADQFFTWNALVGSLGLSETKTLGIRKDRRGINAFKCRLKTGRTTIYPLKGMYLNSGTTDGAAQVQLECLRQLGFSTNDSDGNPLNQILIPYIGDQKTIEMARVGRDDQTDSGSAVHRRNWLLLIPALFHVSMNFAQDLMERTHWAPTDIQEDPDFKGKGKASEMRTFSLHTIQSDSILLQYKDISADTLHFSKLDALLRMSFNARLTACLIWVCHRQGFIRSDNPTSEEVKTSLSRLRDDQFDSCTSEVHEMLFSSHAWNGEYRDPRTKAILPASSNSFITLCRFMQQLRTYFTFREAVRQGDINKIETLLPLLAVLFFGANKHKYGTEMLWLHWLLSSTTCTPELRRTIRGCLIVKQTKESNYTGVDHAVELGNLAIKTDLKHFKNSTHTIETTIGTNSLTSSYMKELRLGLEEPLGIKYNPGHTVKDVVPDTFALISSILADKKMGIVPVSKETGQNKRKQFVSEDILKQGYTKIFDKIKDFNQRCVDDKTRGAPTPFDEPAVMETDSNETEIAIQREERVKWNAGLTLDEE